MGWGWDGGGWGKNQRGKERQTYIDLDTLVRVWLGHDAKGTTRKKKEWKNE
jgi:hypothetical protein